MPAMKKNSEQNIKYFRSIVKNETKKLQTISKKWLMEKKNSELSEDVIGDIDVAAGQAELLIKERFSQFESLIVDCELNRGEKKVTLQDLEGFWDIILIQADQIHGKFDKLLELKENNWVPKPISLPVNLKRKPLTPRNNLLIKVRKPVQTKSSLREHILAAKRKMQIERNLNDGNSTELKKDNSISPCKEIKNNETDTTTPDSFDETKKFEAGFFNVNTPVKASAPDIRRETVVSATPKLLSSTALKKQLEKSPLQHKDYFPCMRITRSMKKKTPV